MFVILPEGTKVPDDVEDTVGNLLAPYDENIEVEPYQEECWCVSMTVRKWVSEQMIAKFDVHWEDAEGNRVSYEETQEETEGFLGRTMLATKTGYKFVGGVESFRESFGPIREAIEAKYAEVTLPSGRVVKVGGMFDSWPDVERGSDDYKAFSDLYAQKEEEFDAAWKEHLAPWTDAEAAFEIEAVKQGHRKPDPTCGFYTEDFLKQHYNDNDNGDGTWTIGDVTVRPGDRFEDNSGCGGTGVATSTYNPKSQWDWWVIGGRWDGAASDLEPIDDGEGGFNFGDEFHQIGRNLIKMSDATDTAPFAFVTPDGKWNGKGKMGWWGVSIGDEDHTTWQEVWAKTKEAFADHYVVGVDCHI